MIFQGLIIKHNVPQYVSLRFIKYLFLYKLGRLHILDVLTSIYSVVSIELLFLMSESNRKPVVNSNMPRQDRVLQQIPPLKSSHLTINDNTYF
jgi:hypothetical protein